MDRGYGCVWGGFVCNLFTWNLEVVIICALYAGCVCVGVGINLDLVGCVACMFWFWFKIRSLVRGGSFCFGLCLWI